MEYVGIADYVQVEVFGFETALTSGAAAWQACTCTPVCRKAPSGATKWHSAMAEGKVAALPAQVERCGFSLAAGGRKRVVVPADLGSREPIVVWRPNVRARP